VNVFFDVDETILGYDNSLRPFVRDVFRQLAADGHLVYVWSGARSPAEVAEVVARHDLAPYVTDCFHKPIIDPRAAWVATGVEVQPDFVVDDYPGIVEAFGGMQVRSYPLAAPSDTEMHRVYEVITAAAAGSS
jgi:hypothetical protein